MSTKLDYTYTDPDGLTIGQVHEEGSVFRIQASSINSFFSYTASWYREKLLNMGEGFAGNTASVLGTSVHYVAQRFADSGDVSAEDVEEIQKYITQESETNPDVEPAQINRHLTVMSHTIVNFLAKHPTHISEAFTEFEVLPGITVGGSIDGIVSNEGFSREEILAGKGTVTIRDYKTHGSTSNPTKITKAYEWQCLVYAWVLKQYGITATAMELVYISRDNTGRISPTNGKPMKDYPSTVNSLFHPVTPESLDFMDSIIKLIADSVHVFKTQPELRYLLAQDLRLKSNTDNLMSASVEVEV